MPNYEYKCPKCGYETTQTNPVDERHDGPPCPQCAVSVGAVQPIEGEEETPETSDEAPQMELQVSTDVSFRGTPTEKFHGNRHRKSEVSKGNLPDRFANIEELEEDAKKRNQFAKDDDGDDE